LRLRPRGLIPDISFGREPSNSTGGTFTRVASGSPAHIRQPISQAEIDQLFDADKRGLVVTLRDLKLVEAAGFSNPLHASRKSWLRNVGLFCSENFDQLKGACATEGHYHCPNNRVVDV
jgi:hypothetical protein